MKIGLPHCSTQRRALGTPAAVQCRSEAPERPLLRPNPGRVFWGHDAHRRTDALLRHSAAFSSMQRRVGAYWIDSTSSGLWAIHPSGLSPCASSRALTVSGWTISTAVSDGLADDGQLLSQGDVLGHHGGLGHKHRPDEQHHRLHNAHVVALGHRGNRQW